MKLPAGVCIAIGALIGLWGCTVGDVEVSLEPDAGSVDPGSGDGCGVSGCTGEIRWSLTFGGPGDEMAAQVLYDSSDQPVVAGTFSETIDFGASQLDSAGSADSFAVQLGSDGSIHQSLRTGGPAYDLSGFTLTGDDRLVTSHTFEGAMQVGDMEFASYGDQDAALIEMGWDGEPLWKRQFGNDLRQHAGSVAIGARGDATVTGYSAGGTIDLGGGPLTIGGQVCGNYLARYRANGSHVWSRLFDGVDSNWGLAVFVDEDDGAVVGGTVRGMVDLGGGPLPGGADSDVVVGYFDENGSHVWSKRFGDEAMQSAFFGRADDGSVIMAGRFGGTMRFGKIVLHNDDESSRDMFVAKLDRSGEPVWARSWPGDAGTFYVSTDHDGNIILSGWFTDPMDFGCGLLVSAGEQDGFVVKLDDGGDCLWSRRFGGASQDWAIGATPDDFGNIIAAGAFGGEMTIGSTTYQATDRYDAFVVALTR